MRAPQSLKDTDTLRAQPSPPGARPQTAPSLGAGRCLGAMPHRGPGWLEGVPFPSGVGEGRDGRTSAAWVSVYPGMWAQADALRESL